jgi:hypothetical protein
VDIQNNITSLWKIQFDGANIRTPQAVSYAFATTPALGRLTDVAAVTHTATDGAGTVATWYAHAFQAPTVVGAGADRIVTDLSNIYVAAPIVTTMVATRSYSSWDAGNVYMAAGQRANVRTIATSPVTVTATDYAINCTGSTPGTDVAQTVNLTITAATFGSGRMLAIIDGGGDASNHNITINSAGGNTFNGAASPLVINTNGRCVVLMGDGGTNWLIFSTT